MATSNQKFAEVVKLYFKENLMLLSYAWCRKNVLKITGSQRLKYIGPLIDFNRPGQLRIANTTVTLFLKKRLDVIKAQNGRHIADLV